MMTSTTTTTRPDHTCPECDAPVVGMEPCANCGRSPEVQMVEDDDDQHDGGYYFERQIAALG
jgi:hypothetical protein